jgi:hypothetical protein
VNQDSANLEGELATLKEEMSEFRGLKAATADRRLRHEQEIRDMKHDVELLRKASDESGVTGTTDRGCGECAKGRWADGGPMRICESAISKQ